MSVNQQLRTMEYRDQRAESFIAQAHQLLAQAEELEARLTKSIANVDQLQQRFHSLQRHFDLVLVRAREQVRIAQPVRQQLQLDQR